MASGETCIMSGFKYLAALFVAAAMLAAGAAQAMDIIRFDQMAAKDRQAFLDFQSKAAETVLQQEGRNADALKVHHLFNDIAPGSRLPLGEAELEMNLDNARVRDAEKHAQNHDAPRVQVEAALIGTLSKHSVQMTPDFAKAFMQMTGTFQP